MVIYFIYYMHQGEKVKGFSRKVYILTDGMADIVQGEHKLTVTFGKTDTQMGKMWYTDC